MARFDKLQANEAAPADAVVVTLWKATGRTVADVVCPANSVGGELSIAEFPRPVPLALERAEEMRKLCNLSRVVISLSDNALWRPQWGDLIDRDLNEVVVERSTTPKLRVYG